MLPPGRKNSKSTTPKPVSSQQTSSSSRGGWLQNLVTDNLHTSLADMPVIEFPQPETLSQPQTPPPTLPPRSSASPPPSTSTTTQPPGWMFMPVVSDLRVPEPAASPMQHLSPQQTSSSFSGGWLPNLDTNSLHTPLADTSVIEFPQSGTSSQPQTLPPTLPPRSPVPPRLSTGTTTRPPSFMSITVAPVSRTPELPASPMPPLAPGDGVGGFALIPPLYREFARDDFLRGTTDHTHLFGPEFSPHPDSSSPNFETAGTSEGVHAGVWPAYNRVSEEFDEKRSKIWTDDLDVLLIFASLFSAIVTAFLIMALADLQPNYQQQTALLLYQLLNGRDPNLANISDPTIPQKPTGSAIAVNCLWFISLSASLGASFGAIICKGWLTQYSSYTTQVSGFHRAYQRHTQFMAFGRLGIHNFIDFLSPLLHSSVFLFFTGVIIYLRRLDETVTVVLVVVGGIFGIAYLLLIILPFVKDPPFRNYSTFLPYRLSVAAGGIVISIVKGFARFLCHIIGVILRPSVQTILSTGAFHDWYMRARAMFPGKYKHMRVWWDEALLDPPDIDITEKVQEEAILWLSQVPLDPSESKALVSSLATISSRPYNFFGKPVIAFANSVLEALPSEDLKQAIDCILVLGHAKFQSAVDRGLDRDHNVGGVRVPHSVACAAQRLAVSALSSTDFQDIRGQLLTAVAWLSPVNGTNSTSWNGLVLEIKDRWTFIEKIGIMLKRHVDGKEPLDTKVLINLIQGMHACIPRDEHGSASSIVPFLASFCKNFNSPWSKDEDVLRALITYALDLLLPLQGRKPLVERRIKFNDLASELIDALMANTPYPDVVAFAFWLVYRVPYAFKSREKMLMDIAYIWRKTNEAISKANSEAISGANSEAVSKANPEVISEVHRRHLNYYATDAFIAIAQYHVVTNGGLPSLAYHPALELLSAALKSGYSRLVAIYTMAMILNLGTWTQVGTAMNEIEVEPITDVLSSSYGDLEQNTIVEEVVEVQIYSALALLKLPEPTVKPNVRVVKELIEQMKKKVEGSSVGDSSGARNSEADIEVDRKRWKAIYLSALLSTFLPNDEREDQVEQLRTMVRRLLENK